MNWLLIVGILIFSTMPLFRLYIVFRSSKREETVAWTTPVLVEICIGLEINGCMPADGYVPPEF
jgi:hypothetical protein